VYNPVPKEIRGFKSEKRYRNLDRSGSALAETISKMKNAAPGRLARVQEYLKGINPNIVAVDVLAVDSEEPEADLHPAAGSVLFDSLVEGSRTRRVVVTSHSPDLLDREPTRLRMRILRQVESASAEAGRY
jgi:predicted ATP-dependent endonuclease of OLD family